MRKILTLKLLQEEVDLLDWLVRYHRLGSRSEGLRQALIDGAKAIWCGDKAIALVLSARKLVEEEAPRSAPRRSRLVVHTVPLPPQTPRKRRRPESA